jgi:serine/threonine protein kinase/ABC-type sugar transport system substrate-binding protein
MELKRLIGRRIQDVVVKEPIGKGGMAHVFRGYQTSVHRDVAVKIVFLDRDREDNAFAKRFAQEAEVIASLEHIHILPIYAYGIEDDIAYIVMRLLRGGSVADMLDDGPLPLERTAELFDQIAHGLAYAHSKGVIHRDLKPSNMMLDDTGNAYLTDFGLAKIVVGGEDLTKTGNIVGTPNYMSPEQLRGESLDHRSDIYSLGVVLYHMLTGRPPFEAADSGDAISVIYKHLEKAPEPPSRINPHVTPQVEAVVLRALSKKPEDRFDNAVEMARELKQALNMSISTGSYPQVHPSLIHVHHETADSKEFSPTPQVIRKLALFIAVEALVIVLVLAALFLFNQKNGQHSIAPNVIAGESGKAADVMPSDDEIRVAQKQLGEDGFIAHIACNQTSEYHAGQNREIRDFFTDYALRSRAYDSNTDEYLQLTLIDKARTEGAVGLVICALNTTILDETLRSVQQANMPLVLLNPGDNGYGGVMLVSDNYLIGLKSGQVAGKMIQNQMDGKAEVVVLDYPDLPIIVERAKGLEDGVLEFAPEAHIIGRYLGGTRELGEASIEQLIAEGVHFDVIVSINDAGSFGAIDALEEAHIAPNAVYIFSVDAETLAREYMLTDYYIRGSIDPGRTAFSKAAVDSMVKLLAGSAIPETIIVPPGNVITKDLLETHGR